MEDIFKGIWDMDFSKKVSKVTDFRWLFGAKILDFFYLGFPAKFGGFRQN